MKWYKTIAILVLFGISTKFGVTSFPMTITPQHARVHPRDNVTVICRGKAEFSDCQFTWWDVDDVKEGPYFNFSRGHDSESAYLKNSTLLNWRLAGYQYEGEGLQHGECGIQLFGVMLRYRMLSCRARTLGGSWQYASMTICAEAKEPFELGFSPEEAVVLPGNPIQILSWTRGSLSTCNFRFPGLDVIVFNNRLENPRNNTTRGRGRKIRVATPLGSNNRTSATNVWSFYGSPLKNGSCGVKLHNVYEERNGWVYFEAETSDGRYDRRVFYLTVARAPANLTMTVSRHILIENEEYTATCKVSDSRPVANITWYLGDRLLRRDNLDDSKAENLDASPWRWNHGLHPIEQTMTLMARKEDNGKELRCEVDHLAMIQHMVSITPITVISTSSCPALWPNDGIILDCRFMGNQVDCFMPMKAGSVVNMTPRCKEGQSLSNDSRYRRITCLNTRMWDNPVLTCQQAVFSPAISLCPALLSNNGVILDCRFMGRPVNCSLPMVVGSVVNMNPQCKEGLSIPNESRYRSITCLSTEMWDKPVLKCQAGCGVSMGADNRPLITSGAPVAFGEYPWHVGIYKLHDGAYEQICSGTLITLNTIITAASCVWKVRRDDDSFNSSLYKVAAGKLHRGWEIEDAHIQRRDVASLLVPERYSGRDTNYQSNIMLLKVTRAFDLTDYVNVACVDLETNRYDEQNSFEGAVASVPGWAFTEEDSPGPVLKSVTLPHVTHLVCHSMLAPNLQGFLTGDKFCVGSTSDYEGYTVCESDYGAGLVFYSETLHKYFLRGIASVALKPITNREICYSSQLLSFMYFASFAKWVQTNIS